MPLDVCVDVFIARKRADGNNLFLDSLTLLSPAYLFSVPLFFWNIWCSQKF